MPQARPGRKTGKEENMPKILLLCAMILLFLLPSCSSSVEKRPEISEPQESLWYVCLRNERIGVERILQVRAISRTLAVDFALDRARNEGWGTAPIGLVWIQNAPEKP